MNLLTLNLWEQVCEGFASRHSTVLRDLWFKHTRPLSFSRGVFVLGVPNLFVREWLEKKYVHEIEELFQEITGSPVKILIKIDGYLYRLMNEMKTDPAGTKPSRLTPSEHDEQIPGPFVVRPENKIACSAFEKVLHDAPACTFSPLFFYGPPGTGKSHLVRQFLCQAKQTSFFSSIRMVDALAFASEFRKAARGGDRVRFRGEILRTDLLVLDEIHRLKGKIKTQLEFLSILKYLGERQRQVILVSRHHPRDIEYFDDSLASFCLSGMVISILGYSVGSIVEINAQKIRAEGLTAPPTLLETIARLKGLGIDEQMRLIRKVVGYAEERNEAPTAQFFRAHFPTYESEAAGIEDRVERIIELVVEATGVEREMITSASKVRKVVEARYLVIYLASTLLKISSRRITRWLGNISPSIVPYAKRRVEQRRRDEARFDNLILDLQSDIDGGQRHLF